MEINDAIFDAVKANLTNDSDMNSNELVMKICLGTATEEEKEEWKKTTNLPEEKLKEFCDIGYNFASNIDFKEQLDEIRKEFKEQLDEIRKEFKEQLDEIRKDKGKELDMENYTQFI